jgi:hypothetical protein
VAILNTPLLWDRRPLFALALRKLQRRLPALVFLRTRGNMGRVVFTKGARSKECSQINVA